MRGRLPHFILVVATVVGAGCFVGEASRGLRCIDDQDCGTRLACIEEICGGPPAVSSTTTGEVPDTTIGTTDESGTTQADPCEGMPYDDCNPLEDSECTQECRWVRCDDGIWDADYEDCDPSDPQWQPGEGERCTDACQLAIFWDDMSDPEGWHTEVQGDDPNAAGWVHDAAAQAWHSGPYHEGGVAVVLRSDPFVVPSRPVGTRIELRVDHTYGFQFCDHLPPGDGAVIRIRSGERHQVVEPLEGYPGAIEHICGSNPPNPLGEVAAFNGPGTTSRQDRVFLDDYEGMSIELELVVGYDCQVAGASDPCNAAVPDAWRIRDVVVGAFSIDGA